MTRHGEVEHSVVVEVSHGQTKGADSGGEEVSSLEGAIAVAQQHADTGRSLIGGIVRHGEVQDTVANKVPDHHRPGIPPGGISMRRLETAVAIAQQNAHARAGAREYV